MRVIPAIQEQRALVQDIASRGGVVDVKAADADGDWDFERMMFADVLAAFGVLGKLKEFRHICEDGGEVVLASVLEMIDSFSKMVETLT